MNEAEKRIREALADEALHDEGASVSDTLYAAHVFEEVCSPENIAALLAEIDRLRAAVQHESDCVEAANAEIARLTRERDEALAARDALRAACKTTLMLRQLGGMMPGTKAVIDVAIHHAEEALAQIEQERSEQAKEG